DTPVRDGPPAPARGGNAAEKRTKGRRTRGRADIGRPEQRRSSRRDAGPNGAPELPGEAHVDRPVAQLGVQTADREAARARELEVDAGARRCHARGDDDPW